MNHYLYSYLHFISVHLIATVLMPLAIGGAYLLGYRRGKRKLLVRLRMNLSLLRDMIKFKTGRMYDPTAKAIFHLCHFLATGESSSLKSANEEIAVNKSQDWRKFLTWLREFATANAPRATERQRCKTHSPPLRSVHPSAHPIIA